MAAVPSLQDILIRPDVWRGGLAGAEMPALASGFPMLDAELPGGGWPRGAVSEVLCDAYGIGAGALLLPLVRALHAQARWVVLVAPPHGLHAPAWVAGGADCAHLLVIAPATQRDVLWAAEQALSSGAVAAVICWAAQANAAQMRRLQVAAAGRAALCLVFRPLRMRAEASPAPLRLALSAGPRGALSVEVLKRRGPPCGGALFLEVPRPCAWRDDHAPLVAGSASAAVADRGARPLAAA